MRRNRGNGRAQVTGDHAQTTAQPGVIVSEVRIEASPETIFPFFTDPAKLVLWKGITAELDPRPGSRYRCDLNGTDVTLGEYVVIDPPRRIVFTWGWESAGSPVPPGSSTVEITLSPDGAATLLRLTHRDLPEAVRGEHRQGWDHYLARLAIAATGGDPGPDSMMQPPTEA